MSEEGALPLVKRRQTSTEEAHFAQAMHNEMTPRIRVVE
jgi:hypothetical protein